MPPRNWTLEDEQLLRQRYPTEGAAALASILGRDRLSIKSKAQALGVQMIASQRKRVRSETMAKAEASALAALDKVARIVPPPRRRPSEPPGTYQRPPPQIAPTDRSVYAVISSEALAVAEEYVAYRRAQGWRPQEILADLGLPIERGRTRDFVSDIALLWLEEVAPASRAKDAERRVRARSATMVKARMVRGRVASTLSTDFPASA